MPSTMTRLALFVVAVMQLSQPLSASAFSWNKYGYSGPVGFEWPPDRAWDYDTALTEPCGSANVGNRTEFPLTYGAISLEQKQEAYDFQLSITYSSNPKNNSAFLPITPVQSSLEYSQLCFNLSSLPDNPTAGRNATLQLQYTATWFGYGRQPQRRHMAVNETFYVCADITLVESADFLLDDASPCFNLTADYENSDQWPGWPWDNGDGDDTDGSDADESKGGVNGSGFSVGAVVGIAVGGFLAVAIIAAIVAWGIYGARKMKEEKAKAEAAAVEEGDVKKLSEEEEIAAAKKLDDSDSWSLT